MERTALLLFFGVHGRIAMGQFRQVSLEEFLREEKKNKMNFFRS